MTVFFRLDENISYKICLAAEAIGIPQGLKFEAPYLIGRTAEKDPNWIERLSRRGKATDVRCVFLGDAFTEPERAAAEQAGLIVFFVPGPRWWRELRRMSQAAYFMRWLSAMVEMGKTFPAGSQVQLPPSFSPRTDLKPLKSVLGLSRRRGGRPRRRGPIKGPLI